MKPIYPAALGTVAAFPGPLAAGARLPADPSAFQAVGHDAPYGE